MLLCAVCAVLVIGFAMVRAYILHNIRCCPAPRNTCISQLKQLEGATAVWAMEHGKNTNDIPTWSEIIGETNYIAKKPECPGGGSYSLGAVGKLPRCTVAGHVLVEGAVVHSTRPMTAREAAEANIRATEEFGRTTGIK